MNMQGGSPEAPSPAASGRAAQTWPAKLLPGSRRCRCASDPDGRASSRGLCWSQKQSPRLQAWKGPHFPGRGACFLLQSPHLWRIREEMYLVFFFLCF